MPGFHLEWITFPYWVCPTILTSSYCPFQSIDSLWFWKVISNIFAVAFYSFFQQLRVELASETGLICCNTFVIVLKSSGFLVFASLLLLFQHYFRLFSINFFLSIFVQKSCHFNNAEFENQLRIWVIDKNSMNEIWRVIIHFTFDKRVSEINIWSEQSHDCYFQLGLLRVLSLSLNCI